MKKILTILFLFLGLNQIIAQCTVNAIPTFTNLNCDDSIIISVSGFADFALDNDFNTGLPGTNWTATSSAQYDNPYLPSLTNDTYLWMGPNADVPRELTSLPLDLAFGGQICFDLVYAVQGQGSPVEGPDEPDEGVSLQYSTDGGTTWIDIAYFNPNGVSGPNGDGIMPANPGPGSGLGSASGQTPFTQWGTYCFPIPPGAQTSATQVQWSQINSSTAQFDHWGLDNIQIQVGDPSYTFYNADNGSTIDTNYTVIYPTTDTIVNLIYTNGIDDTCTVSVPLTVNPTDAGPDLFACEGLGHPLEVTGVSPWSPVLWSPPTFLDDPTSITPYTNPVAPPQSQTYTVTTNCGTDDVTIFLVDSFDININEPDTICIGGDIQLTATATPASVTIGSYEWNPAFMLNNTSTQTVIATPATTSEIYVKATSTDGCIRRDTVTAYVDLFTLDLNILPANPLICLGDSIELYTEVLPPSFPYVVAQVPYDTSTTFGAITNPISFTSGNNNQTIPIGFGFDFFGTNYTNVSVSSNGWLSFTSTTLTSSNNATIPATGTPNNLIAFIWDNLNIANGGSAQYYITGTAPNRIFVIEFNDVSFNTVNTGSVSVQVELHEATGIIQINNININNTGSSTITQGIENSTGSQGLAIPGHNNLAFSDSLASYQFIPYLAPTSVDYSWTSTYNITNNLGDTTTVYPLVDFTYEVTGTAASCLSSAQRDVIIDIFDVDASPNVDTICPGSSIQIETVVLGDSLQCELGYLTYEVPFYKEVGTIIPFTYPVAGVSDLITIPFPFEYYCSPQQTFRVTSDGYINFLSQLFTVSANNPIPSSGLIGIAFMWDDLIDSTNTSGYFTTGVTPNRRFVVDFNYVHVDGTQATEPVQGQVVFHETTNIIDIICENCHQDDSDPSATQGLLNTTGTGNGVGMATPGRNNSAWNAFNTVQRFYPRSSLNTNYSIAWTPNIAINDTTIQIPFVSPLTTTQYVVGITNTNTCTYYDTVDIEVINNLTIDAGNDVSICAGGSTQLNAVSNIANTYVWVPNDGSLSDTTIANPIATPLVTTTYIVEASLTSCIEYDTVIVNVSDFNVDSTVLVDEICVANSGSITIYTSGQTAGLQYSNDGGLNFQSSNIFSGLAGGNYNIVIGATNCDTSYTVNIIGGAALMTFTSIDLVQSVCASPGSINITVSGGTAPLEYSIDNGVNFFPDSTFYPNLTAGFYDIIVVDSFGCLLDSTVEITETLSLGVAIDNQTNVSCFGEADGSVTFSPTGGLAPFEYSINGTDFVLTNTFTPIDTGTYFAYVMDANGCSDSTNFTISQPDTLNVDIDVPGNVLCAGGTIDSLITNVTGGTTNYTYLWNTAEVTSSIENIVFGTYWVQTTDANNCVATDTVIISQPIPLYLEISADSALCGGQNSGTAYIDSVSGGISPYTYQWVGPSGNVAGTDTAFNLLAGNYTLTISDFNSCTISESTVVLEPVPVLITLEADTLDCFGDNDACINATISGGTAPYIVSWDNGQVIEDICGLSAGWNTITVTDSKGCIYIDSVEVIQPTVLALSESNTAVTCKGLNNGTATVNVTGGTTNYSYVWNDAMNQTNSTATNLLAGTFQVIVTDNNGCQDSISTTIAEPTDSLSLSTVSVTDVLCNGANTGSILVNTSGGTINYTYSWTNGGGTNEDLTAASAGTYTLTVTDANGCSDNLTEMITEPTALVINTTQVNVDCFSASTASIDATISGGTTNYSYAWIGPNGYTANTEDIGGLLVGTYTLTVTDANSCTLSETVIISEPVTVVADFTPQAISCFGGNDGSLTVNINSGGTAPFTYLWGTSANNQTSAIASNLIAGTYDVTITDANGCTYNFSSSVTEPNTPITLTMDTTDITCAGYDNGSATVSAIGGTPGYTYLWSDPTGQTTATASNLGFATFQVTVTDANGCSEIASVFIDQPNPLTVSTVIDSANCWGGPSGSIEVLAGGGTPLGEYSYSIDGGTTFQADPNFYDLGAGIYDEIVVQDLGSTIECISQPISATVFEPAYFIVRVNPMDTTLELEESVTLELIIEEPYNLSDVGQISWFPTIGLDCSDCLNPTVLTYEHYTEYVASISYFGDDNELCNSSTSTIIIVENNLELFIPNAFTPGGFDDMNNTFEIFGEGIEYVTMQVFNRWGEKIFESANQKVSWDGTYKGIMQNPGVYTFYINVQYLDGKEVERKGSVTLLR